MFSSVEVGMKYIMYPYGDNGLIVRGINSIRYGHKTNNVTLSPYVLLRRSGYEIHNVSLWRLRINSTRCIIQPLTIVVGVCLNSVVSSGCYVLLFPSLPPMKFHFYELLLWHYFFHSLLASHRVPLWVPFVG